MLVVIPLKTLEKAKERLSADISSSQRQDIVWWMLEKLTKALSSSAHVSDIVLLTRDASFNNLAQQKGLSILSLEQDQDLNAALQAANNKLALENNSKSILFIAGDLPYVTASDIDTLVEQHHEQGADISLCPSSDELGTNAILMNTDVDFLFEFGSDSFTKHQQQATKKNLCINVVKNKNFGRDIDMPEHLERLKNNLPELSVFINRKNLVPFKQEDWFSLTQIEQPAALMQAASKIRDKHYGNIITYSRKVFIPLTHLCRNVCHYCTFAKTPSHTEQLYMSVEEVIAKVKEAKQLGCKEILFTLGERPELRYTKAKQKLNEMGFDSTLEYLAFVAEQTLKETGLLPHINAGCMSEEEIKQFQHISPSMGLMLENVSRRLCEKNMPHYGSPDKDPVLRLQTIKAAGKLNIPFTTGILVGIGETRLERIESLIAIEKLHQQYGHIQEVIIQNFRAKADTKMHHAEEPSLDDFLWTIALARLILSPDISIQAPPNLSPDALSKLIDAGINDWGGVSPLTPDFVNPEAPWPHLDNLSSITELCGKHLHERLTVYPRFIYPNTPWIEKSLYKKVLPLSDCGGLARTDQWITGGTQAPPVSKNKTNKIKLRGIASQEIKEIIDRARNYETISEDDLVRLFESRDEDFEFICESANELRKELCGDNITYVVNRNINYTNICSFKCSFCAFSKGQVKAELREKPYKMSLEEISQRTLEAHTRGATEVCLQGGIHPDYDGDYYLDVCMAIKSVCPDMHIHAFSPLEIWQGAHSINMPVVEFLSELKKAGLGSLPGTAAEILDDEIRQIICPDKINTAQWLEVIETAHAVGLATTSTIMFGHVETYRSWAKHLLQLQALQQRTKCITEFVPLPFVAEQTPIYKRGLSRIGPSFREVVLMHAVSRLLFGKLIPNIQTSWVKLGEEGVKVCLESGANDLGGSLMNESITRAAGAAHGQEFTPEKLKQIIHDLDRTPTQRNTLYGSVNLTSEKIFFSQGKILSDISHAHSATSHERRSTRSVE